MFIVSIQINVNRQWLIPFRCYSMIFIQASIRYLIKGNHEITMKSITFGHIHLKISNA